MMHFKHKESGHVAEVEQYEDGTWCEIDPETHEEHWWSWAEFAKQWDLVDPLDVVCGDIVLARQQRPVGDLELVARGEFADLAHRQTIFLERLEHRHDKRAYEIWHLRCALNELRGAVRELRDRKKKASGEHLGACARQIKMSAEASYQT